MNGSLLVRRRREPASRTTTTTATVHAAQRGRVRVILVGFVIRTVLAFGGIVAGFYGFWLVWRLLVPVLPGPDQQRERIAPFACYFTDPFVVPLARLTRLPEWVVTLASLLVVSAALVTFDGASDLTVR